MCIDRYSSAQLSLTHTHTKYTVKFVAIRRCRRRSLFGKMYWKSVYLVIVNGLNRIEMKWNEKKNSFISSVIDKSSFRWRPTDRQYFLLWTVIEIPNALTQRLAMHDAQINLLMMHYTCIECQSNSISIINYGKEPCVSQSRARLMKINREKSNCVLLLDGNGTKRYLSV